MSGLIGPEGGYVSSVPPELPPLTGNNVLDSLIQLNLSPNDILKLLEQNPWFDVEQVCDRIMEVANNLGDGLDPEGKGLWIRPYIYEEIGLDNATIDSEDFLDSPAT